MKSNRQDRTVSRLLEHIFYTADILVFCHKEVLFVHRVDVNATQNLSVECVERLVRVPVCEKILPVKSQESTTQSCSC